MVKNEIKTISKLCQLVSRHEVRDEDGDVNSVAFGGNCGNFAIGLLFFLADIDFPFEEWEIGFLFNNIKSLNEIYEDNEAELNHVILFLDGNAFDGNGLTNVFNWHGKLFRTDDIHKIEDIIQNFTIPSISIDEIQKLLKTTWKKLDNKKDCLN